MLETRFMADIGDETLFVTPDVDLPDPDDLDEDEEPPYDEEQVIGLYEHLPDIGPGVVASGCEKLCRVHLTRVEPVSYTHLTLPTINGECRSRWSPSH